MKSCYTFLSSEKRIKITVKPEFLNKCPNPEDKCIIELINVYHICSYLHNPSGPALHRLGDNSMEFWINGKNITKRDPEKAKQMSDEYKHNKENVV